MAGTSLGRILRFGTFEVDLRSKELRRAGMRVRLPEQSFAVLAALLEHPGEVVTRDDLRARLWPDGTFVEFDDGLNHAVARLRRALGDSPVASRFVETLPRAGYRFIAPVTDEGPPAAAPAPPVRSDRPWRLTALAVAAGTLTLLAAGGAVLVIGSRPAPTPILSRTVRIAGASGVEHAPAWSPDGRRLAYAADASGHTAIWVRTWDAGEPRLLSDVPPAFEANPAWSPDGAWIAFASTRSGGGIFVAPAGGGAPRRVVPLAFTPSADLIGSVPTLAWSPQGTHLAYALGVEGRTGLFIVPVAGGEPVQVPLPGDIRAFSIVQPAWSRDGGRLAFAALSGTLRTVSRIWTVRRDGSDPVPVTDHASLNLHPQWTADGSGLYFLSDRGGSLDVHWAAVDRRTHRASAAVPLTAGIGIGAFAVGPDGRRLAYSKRLERSNIWMLPLGADGPLDWSGARPLTSDTHTLEFLDLSRDRQWIVFDSTRAGRSSLWRMRPDGTALARVTDGDADDWHPSLSPDATAVAFHRLADGNRDIWIAPLAGGAPVRLTDGPAKDWLPQWSPDGELIVFGSDRHGNQDVFVMPAAGGPARRLTDHPGNDHNPIWSEDGKAVLFASNREGADALYLVPREGGGVRRLTSHAWEDAVPLLWQDGTIYVWARGNEQVGYWTVDPTRGSVRLLLEGRPPRRQLGISAATDGRAFYFPMWERTSELWIGELAQPRR